MKKKRRFFAYVVALLTACAIVAGVWLFATESGHRFRILAAETILTSQHRYLAKLTFLSEQELAELLAVIHNPVYVNSHGTSLSESIADTIDQEANYKDSNARLMELYVRMVNERTTQNLDREQNNAFLSKIQKKQQEENKLTVTIEQIERRFSDHYFTGKLMTVSNPKNVRLVSSKGEQVNSSFGEQLPILANRANAIGAINASGFLDPNGNGNGGIPIGIVIDDGDIVQTPGGKSAKAFVAGLTDKGLLVTGSYSAEELIRLDVRHAAGFKPQLIADGKKITMEGNGGWGYGPRTAVAQTKDGAILFLVIDGRQPHSIGASITDVQELLLAYGAVNAMSMDGGSSSLMFFNGEIITSPSSVGRIPRYLPNAWVVSPDEGQLVELYSDETLLTSFTAPS